MLDMFTGIIESIGSITHIKKIDATTEVTVRPHLFFDDLHTGDSIAVNGTCLTIIDFTADTFTVTLVPETLKITHFGNLAVGNTVNLERSLNINARLGGHYVQGHVDGVGEIIELHHDAKEAVRIKIKSPSALTKYIVNKGYITLDGMSITVIDISEDEFSVTLIPHTREMTIAKNYFIGTKINIEVDIMSKYVEKLLRSK